MACANGAYEDSLAYFTGLDRAATDRISNRDGRISSDDRFSRAADMVQAHGDYRLRAHRPPQREHQVIWSRSSRAWPQAGYAWHAAIAARIWSHETFLLRWSV